MSHPLRVRGLKQAEDDIESAKQSHPLRVRGLKPRGTRFTNVNTGRILYGCVVKKPIVSALTTNVFLSHPLRVRGLKHLLIQDRKILLCRILYGCVD